MTPEERLEAILKVLEDGKLDKKEFMIVVDVLVEFARETKNLSGEKIEEIKKALSEAVELAKNANDKNLQDIKAQVSQALAKVKDGYTPKKGVDYFDGEPGKDADPEEVKNLVIKELGPKIEEETGASIANKLESLTGEERLSHTAIKGLEDLLKKGGKGTVTLFGGSRGIDVYVDGDNKGLTQYLNLIPGTGVTFNYSRVGERVDIIINSTGGSSLAILPATGAVDDSNTIFTFATEPIIVVVNGTSYRDGHGVTIVGTTATLDSAPGTGGDVYGIG